MSKTNNKEYRFSDLFDLNEIQEIQDSFSAATGVASFITEPDGTPITKPSGFCSLCNEVIRKTKIGLKNCVISDSIVGSPKKDGRRIQRCLSGGLIDVEVSIIVEGKHLANWLVGQVLDEDYKTDDLISYADIIGVNREVYKRELVKGKRISKKQFEHICNFLFLNTQLLSMIAMKNINLTHEINRKILKESELEIAVRQRTKQLEELNARLEEISAELEEEIAKRQNAQIVITTLNNELEEKVKKRTMELEESEENIRQILNSTAEAIY